MSHSNRTEREAFWRSVLDEYSSSGLTIRAFCRSKGISEPSFFAWRKKIQKRNGVPSRNVSANPGKLIPVDVVDSVRVGLTPDEMTPSPWLEIATPNGFTIRVPRNVDTQQLGGLLEVIAGVPSC
jgi:transposase-like protein